MLQKFLIVFFLSFSVLIGCQERPLKYNDVYKNSEGNNLGDADSENNANNGVAVSAISVSSNYIPLKKTSEKLTYNLSAVAVPQNARNLNLNYKIIGNSNDKVKKAGEQTAITVNSKGELSINDLGEYDVEITSEDNSEIKQVVKVSVTEGVNTPVDLSNPSTIFGKYYIEQYGKNKDPYINIGKNSSLFEINVIQNKDKYDTLDIISALFLNGLNIRLLPEGISSYSNMSPEQIAKEIIKHVNARIKDKFVILSFKGSVFTSLVDNGIINENETFNVSLVKIEDLVPNQITSEIEKGINVTKVRPLFPYDSDDYKTIHNYDIKNGKEFILMSVVHPVNATEKGIVYKSLNKRIADINSAGVVTVHKTGDVNFELRSKADNNIKWYVGFNFIDTSTRVSSVKINNGKTELLVGEQLNLRYGISPNNATNKNVWFSSPNKEILSVTSNGAVKAVGEGIGYVYLRSEDNYDKHDVLKIEVRDKKSLFEYNVTSVTNKPSNVYLRENGKFQLEVGPFPKYAKNPKLTYRVDSQGVKIASVDDNGLISGLSVGNTKIIISAVSNPKLQEEINVFVRSAESKDVEITNINLNKPYENLYVGVTSSEVEVSTEPALSTTTFKNKVSVFSNSYNVLTVEQNLEKSTKDKLVYKINPVGEGVATVVIESENGKRKEIVYNVYKKMNIQGQYKVKSATYQIGDEQLIISPKDNTKNYGGEFSFYIDEVNKQLISTGRVQFIPSNPESIGVLNDKRYIYINDALNFEEDIHAIFRRDKLEQNRIKIVDNKNVEYSYSNKDFYAIFNLEKITDNNIKVADRQAFLTPMNIVGDLKSLEGYYHGTYSFQRSFDLFGNKYYPLHTPTECKYEDIKSIFFNPIVNKSYDKNKDDPYGRCDDLDGTKIPLWGRVKDGWSNKGYRAELIITVDNNDIRMNVKDMKSGHNTFNVGRGHFKLFYTDLKNIDYSTYCKDMNGKRCVVNNTKINSSNWGRSYTDKDARFYFEDMGSNIINFEIDTSSDALIRLFTQFKKVSDKARIDNNGEIIQLSSEPYNEGNIDGDMSPANHPHDSMKISEIEEHVNTSSGIIE